MVRMMQLLSDLIDETEKDGISKIKTLQSLLKGQKLVLHFINDTRYYTN
jgi:hypothetical protein